MGRKLKVQKLANDLTAVELTRRELLRRAAVIGVAAPVLGSLIAACEPDDDEEPADASDETDDDAEDDTGDEGDASDEDPDSDASDDEDAEADDEGAEATAEEDGDGRRGGALNVALRGEPPTLDVMQETAQVSAFAMLHVYELPFTWNEDMEVTPELVEEYETSEDGQVYTLTLRSGVTFHNSEDLTAADFVASVERWLNVSPRSEGMSAVLDAVEEVDELTVEFRLTDVYSPFADMLSRQTGGCPIYPASVIEASESGDLTEYIGTGPYQFVEHVPDRHIHLERFEEFVSRDEEPSGYAGRKNQYLDEIFFQPVPEESSRVAGLQAGDYHYLEAINPEQFETLEGVEGVTTEILPSIRSTLVVFNTRGGPTEDTNVRRALQAALNLEELLVAGVGEDYYSLDPGVQMEGTAWHTTVGEELYNQGDLDRAMELLEDAGYDGEPVRILAREDQTDLFNMAQVAAQQIEDAGVTVDLQRYDQSTFFEVRQDPAAWEVFLTNQGVTSHPLLISYITATDWPGWWDSDQKVELVNQLEAEPDFEAGYEIWEEIQRVFYEEDIPMVKIGNIANLNARSSRLGGFVPMTETGGGVPFWNMWLE